MSPAPKEAAPVLLVCADPVWRRTLRATLSEGRRVVERSLERFVAGEIPHDARPLVVAIAEEELGQEERNALRSPEWEGELLLLLRGLSDEATRDLLTALEPRWAATAPIGAAALHYAVAQVSAPARSARAQHRPARAILGVSGAIRKVLEQVGQVAPTPASVLVLGETGTGKELVARAIHDQSPRARQRFVAINCGAVPESLLEAELFGALKGAYTGSDRDRDGLFQQADRGTLFLDEIGDMPASLQVKLLRVLETGEVRPLGGTEQRIVDVRVISATHRHLEDAVEEGSFRQDLYYRLNTVMLEVPPLRRRRVDIPFLAQHFAEEFGVAHARQITLGDDFLDGLAQADFPGNVRELRNAVERAIALAGPDQVLGLEDVPLQGGAPAAFAMGTLRDRIAHVEVHAIREALERFEGNKTHAAEALGISRLGLRQKMRRLGLE